MTTTASPPRPTELKARIDPATFYRSELPEGTPHLKANGSGWSQNVPCPFHDDRTGSFGAHLETGAFRCFGCDAHGGSVLDFIMLRDGLDLTGARLALADRYGIGTQDAPPARPPKAPPAAPVAPAPMEPITPEALASRPMAHPKHGTPSATWTYADPDGHPLCFVLRFDPAEGRKVFAPQTWTQAKGWQWKAPPAPRPLYGLDRLAERPEADAVFAEGEKAADAAALLLPEYVAVTTANGAQSPDKADFGPLAGRRILIWPDHDAPGAEYARKVSALALASGALSVEVLDIASLAPDPATGEARELPKGWDAADALEEGFTPAHLNRVLGKPDTRQESKPDPATKAKATPGTALPGNDGSPYRLTRGGVFFHGEDADGEPLPPLLICSPLHITARTRDDRNTAWGYLLEWKDPDGHPHQWAMPAELLSGDGAEYRSILLAGGVFIAPGIKARQHLTSYIQGARADARARCTDRTGWHGPAFVLPDRVIGTQGEDRVIYQSAVGSASYYTEKGTLADWRREVASLASGNSRLLFCASVGFASVLLDLIGDENGGFHLKGTSSEGKSSALYAAASIFGGRDYLHRWRATSNGLEAVATAHSGALLILDELGQVDPKEAGEIAYMLANGTGKHRADRTGGARRSQSWRLLFLSTGEIDLTQHMMSIGKRSRAGQEVRLLAFDANPGAGLGIFEDLHGLPGGGAMARALDERTRLYHGTAGPAFIEAVTRDLARLPDIVRDVKQKFLDANLPDGASGEAYRAAGRFALVAVGGELATRYGVTGWGAGEAGRAAATCFKAWLAGQGGAGSRETAGILSQVRRFFENHGEARFFDWNSHDERPIVNRAGVRKLEGDTWTYFVLPETFKEELCAGFDSKAATRVLEGARMLERGSEGFPAGNVRLPGIGLTRCYQIRPFVEQLT